MQSSKLGRYISAGEFYVEENLMTEVTPLCQIAMIIRSEGGKKVALGLKKKKRVSHSRIYTLDS